MIEAEDVGTVCVVGAGAIGISWTALLLALDRQVVVTDPAADAESNLRTGLQGLGVADPGPGLRFGTDLPTAAAEADLVIESGPERLDVKREIFGVLGDACGPDVLLASSSSGLLPSSFQEASRHPERVLVAHPFNPPHLIPLVEVVGGRRTSQEALESAMTTMRHWGRRPIRVRGELPGHVVNRLQAALWREAYHLVDQGVATVSDIDRAIASGPGLRWALLGPFATQHLSGGPGGLEHVLQHLGPPMVEWWDDLGNSPELTTELVTALVEGVREELAGVSEEDLSARRNQALRELIDLKSRSGLD